ncbi:MAG: hypothetical protein U9R43_12895 [Thermodesulfobacteriota bacterium]|nr:hypothetical protein [Thermodesulfobacteriota bacterium]
MLKYTDALEEGLKGITVRIIKEYGATKYLDPDADLQELIKEACLKINSHRQMGSFWPDFYDRKRSKKNPGLK